MTTNSFSRCKFVTHEIDHDFNPPINQKDGLPFYTKNAINNFRTYLDRSDAQGDGCSDYNEFGQIIPNNKMTLYIIYLPSASATEIGNGVDHKTLRDHLQAGKIWNPNPQTNVLNATMGFFPHHNVLINTKTQTIPTTPTTLWSINQSIKIPASILGRRKQAYSSFYNDNIWDIFKRGGTSYPINDLENQNFYFVIDTAKAGSDLMKALTTSFKTSDPKVQNVNLHIIHSVATVGDSAANTLPDAQNWSSPVYVTAHDTNNIDIYSWYMNNTYYSVENSHEFMSSIYVRMSRSTDGWKIKQKWKKPITTKIVKPSIKDSRIENTINKMTPLLEIPTSTDLKETNRFNSSFQRKRSGDYFQILTTYNLPSKLQNTAPAQLFTLKATNVPVPVTGDLTGTSAAIYNTAFGPGPVRTLAYYKSRTYFVTIDFAAFCYAIYFKINSILAGPDYLCRISFD